MGFTVTFIGAGSIGFTRKLVADLLSVAEFADLTIKLHDIDADNLDRIAQLLARDIDANHSRARVHRTTDRREALRDARYVINVARIGGLEAFRHDVEIPLRYGVDQCVGDTLCAGGIFYAQRGIANILDLCRDIRECAEPGARLLNYANPMAMLTWAANTWGGVDCIGLCHGVQGGHAQLTRVIELLWNRDRGHAAGDPDYRTITTDEVDIVCAGINHQTWYVRVEHEGVDWRPRLLEGFRLHPDFRDTEKVRIDMLERFGAYSTESNGHLSEYLPWYRKRPEEIADWISLDAWILGESAGYLRHCSERRNWFEEDFPRWLQEPPHRFTLDRRSEEHGGFIIEALETGRIYRGHFNRTNRGTIDNLPADCVIEAPGYVDRTGLHMTQVGALPLGCAAVCQRAVDVQRLAVQAAIDADIDLLRQAMLLDPLVGAVCNPPEVVQMVDDMLIALGAWMPQWQGEVERARERQDRARTDGTRLPTRDDYRGAARREQRTVAELQAEGRIASDAESVGTR